VKRSRANDTVTVGNQADCNLAARLIQSKIGSIKSTEYGPEELQQFFAVACEQMVTGNERVVTK